VAALWRRLCEDPPFDWLPGGGEALAWINTEAALGEARAAGCPLWGAAPAVVWRVHDKAFAHALAEREGLLPAPLRGAIAVLEPGELQPDDAGLRALRARLEALPAWARERFTLKPRLGSSGRGRVAGAGLAVDTPAIRGALARLAARGGALLEPWLERREDLSAQLCVGADGALRLLGTTRQVLTAAGLYRGQRGLVDARGRVVSGSRHDEALREAAALAASGAAAVGFRGPCGVDAFSFVAPAGCAEAGELLLRPLLELNARFTVGVVAIGLVRQQLPALRRDLGLDAGQRIAFHFGLEPPAAGWPGDAEGLRVVPLGARPALVFARSEELLSRALDGQS
jgi:hypothetical protein